MQLRKVEIDFSDARVDWAAGDPEYAHLFNGISSMVPYLEVMLNKAVRGAKSRLREDETELRREADRFCWQEGRHTKLHLQFNEHLQRTYPWLEADQARIRADFERFWTVKGHKFTLAYSEGFETYGPILTELLFEGSGSRLDDWDEPTVYLWLWHFAEEYEHRMVCHDLFDRLYASNVYRVYGLLYALVHLYGYSLKVAWKMIGTDLETGRLRGRLRTRLRFLRVVGMLVGFLLPRLARAMLPGYDPSAIPPPRRSMEFLDAAAQRYGVRELD